MKIQTIQCENYANSFYIPVHWRVKNDLMEQLEYFNSIRKSQIILKTLVVDKELLNFNAGTNFENIQKTVKEIYSQRKKIAEYLQKICKHYGFKNETYFKAMQIFDMYTHKVINNFVNVVKNKNLNNSTLNNLISSINSNSSSPKPPCEPPLENLKRNSIVICVICLNIACKIEEVNCNYLSFFKTNLLDNKAKNVVFSLKELQKKEIEILKVLNFKTASPTFYQFNNLFIQFFLNELVTLIETENIKSTENFDSQRIYKALINYNEVITKAYSFFNESVFNSPLTSGVICFQSTFLLLVRSFDNSDRVCNLLQVIQDRVDHILNSVINNCDYLQKVKHEALKVVYRVRSKGKCVYEAKSNNEMDVDTC